MQFNQAALDAKMQHLDEIKKYPDLIDRVIGRNIQGKYKVIEQPRVWTGGGGTLFIVETEQGRLFLKTKHKDVTVESKLEEEKGFIEESCEIGRASCRERV